MLSGKNSGKMMSIREESLGEALECREKVRKSDWSRIKNAVEAIALCHNVTPTVDNKGFDNIADRECGDFADIDVADESNKVQESYVYQVKWLSFNV